MERPSVCGHCGKRLSKKQWYYRNGKFFCKQRCFHDNVAKTAADKVKAEAKAAAEAKPEAPAQEGAPAQP